MTKQTTPTGPEGHAQGPRELGHLESDQREPGHLESGQREPGHFESGQREPGRATGVAWCLGSVLLVTAAQLLLKYAVSHLTGLTVAELLPFPAPRWQAPLALLTTGLICYAASMVCWFFALRHLPLNYAYPMLGLSYALVTMLAVVLPWFDEPYSLLQLGGVLCIMVGIWLLHTGRKHPTQPH